MNLKDYYVKVLINNTYQEYEIPLYMGLYSPLPNCSIKLSNIMGFTCKQRQEFTKDLEPYKISDKYYSFKVKQVKE